MSLLNQILGNSELSNIDNRVDDLVAKMGKLNINEKEKSTKNFEDLTGDFLGMVDDSSHTNNSSSSDFEKLFADVNIPVERLSRYSTYDEIYKSIALTKRVISVYVANILSKNPVNNKTLIYKDINESEVSDENKQKKASEFCKKAVDKFDLVSRLKKTIIPNRLCYGDYFVEVVDIEDRIKNTNWDHLNTSVNVMTECNNIIDECNKSTNDLDRYLEKASDFLFEYNDVDPELQGVISGLEETEDPEKTEKPSFDLSKVLLKYHKPHNIIILETNYGTKLGFLEVQRNEDSVHSNSISMMVQKVTNSNNFNSKNDSKKNVEKIIKYVISKIIGRSKNKGHNTKDVQSILSSLDPEVFNFVKRMVVEQGYDRDKNIQTVTPVRVRFIPPAKMVHFLNPGSADYSPFSASILDPMVLTGKLYMLAQLSNTVTKLSRASLIRKWTIDTGPTKMTGNSLNKLKREIYNTRVTLNDLGSFKSMSKILSDFRDVFAISNNGRTPVDFQIQQTGDPNVKTEDLRDLRQELVSLSGIPSPYLGLQDTVQLTEQLSHINQSFAVEISDQQENDIKSINDLIYKISKVAGLDFDPTEYTSVSLTPPIVLVLQLIESTLNSVGNIAGIFGNLQIPVDPYYLLQQYVPQIDWDIFKKKAEEYQKQKAALSSGDEKQQGGSGMGW